MEWKSAALPPDPGTLPSPVYLDPLLRRLLGDGLPNLLVARAEVLAALRDGVLAGAPATEDELPPSAVPSLAAGSRRRVLGEIDHDGFVFAADPADAALFERRLVRHPRNHNQLDVVLHDGRVCVRKRFRSGRFGVRRWGARRVPLLDWVRRSLWVAARLYLYNEAAALLRLRDLPFVPRLRAIDLGDRALYIDYVQGQSLRHRAALAGAPVHDVDLAAAAEDLGHLTGRELQRREVALLDATRPGDYRSEIAAMSRQINDRGVAPLDIKLGNFIRGAASGTLYWIDFEVSRLATQPRWAADLVVQRELLDYLFRRSSRPDRKP
jgi:hypothetical protein